jgi:hypothetical protein
VNIYKEQYHIFALIALFFLLLEMLILPLKKKDSKRFRL